LAFICLFGFIKSVDVVKPIIPIFEIKNNDFRWFWILVWVVVVIGTWSREQVDVLKGASLLSDNSGKLNISAMDMWFVIHRYVPFLMLVFLVFRIRDKRFLPSVVKHYIILGILVLLQIFLGAVHIWFVVPAWTQILHVLAGSALLAYSFLLFLSSKRT
jgi:heme A synthase